MPAAKKPKRRIVKPGMRALEACGDGFWEFDLKDGSAWFNPWFHRKLGWPADTQRTTLGDLQPLLKPAAWKELMAQIRGHLERDLPLDLEFEVRVAADRTEHWHMRGAAHRNSAGQPEYLAGRHARNFPPSAPRRTPRDSRACARPSMHCPWPRRCSMPARASSKPTGNGASSPRPSHRRRSRACAPRTARRRSSSGWIKVRDPRKARDSFGCARSHSSTTARATSR